MLISNALYGRYYYPRNANYSISCGADALLLEHRCRQLVDPEAVRRQFRTEFDSSRNPYMLLDPGPGLRIVDINDA